MPQLSIYVPEELAKQVRKKAKLKGKSLSSYVVSLLKKEAPADGRGDFFEKVVRKLGDDFPNHIERELPENIDFEL